MLFQKIFILLILIFFSGAESENQGQKMENRLDQVPSQTCNSNHCERTDEILKDRLAMYTGGFYYDCTFSVGKNENKKLFKCHKIILAEASDAIANILFKNFAEGQNGKDDPIVIDNNLLPETFDLAMRHIYGNVVEFTTTTQACEMYKFAHKWMLKYLKEDAVSALRKTKADEILLVYEMHKSLGDKEEQKFYLQRIMSETSEVLSSPTWIKASPSTVLEIYEKPSLAVVSEKDLFEPLIKWGTAYSEATGSELRSTIDGALKHIRFLTMFCPDFAELCAEKANVFSAEEKFKIMLSLELGNSKYMPPGFSTIDQWRMIQNYFQLQFDRISRVKVTETIVNCKSPTSGFEFSVKGKGKIFLTHVDLMSLLHKNNHGKEVEFICLLSTDSFDKILNVFKYKGILNAYEPDVKFESPVLLQTNTWYKITVQYLHRNDLTTKQFNYKSSPRSWKWDSAGAEVRVRLPLSHVDIVCIQLFHAPPSY